MKFYLNNKKVSKKTLEQQIGKEKIAERIKYATVKWAEDPGVQISWMDGMRIEHELQE